MIDEPGAGTDLALAPEVRSATVKDSAKSLVAVVGADGFVGGGLVKALKAESAFHTERVVYGQVANGDTHINSAEALLGRADIIINCGGFRVRPGCDYRDYQRSHEGSTSVFVPWIRKEALLIHISSAAVLGKGEDLGNHGRPNPMTFPSPGYALAKLEEDQYLERTSKERGFRVIFLRPATVYSPQGAGMIGTLVKLAKRGITLRLYPRDARQHLVHMDLVADVARRVIQRDDLPNLSHLVVADPYTVTNRELEAMIRRALRKRSIHLPLPAHWMSTLLRYTFHSRNPKVDLKTIGEILGVMACDTVYDPSETFRLVGIDPSQYSMEKTLQPLMAKLLKNETAVGLRRSR